MGTAILVLISINTVDEVAMWSLLAVGVMNSIMWPVVFPLALAGLGRHTEEGSGLLYTAVVGGALVPMLFSLVADPNGLRIAFLLPVLCYFYYCMVWPARQPPRGSGLAEHWTAGATLPTLFGAHAPFCS